VSVSDHDELTVLPVLSCTSNDKAGQQPGEFLTRHVNRDWGALSDRDRKENDYSLEHGFRLLSSYRTNGGDRLRIITESDRSLTTLLLPKEYQRNSLFL
jgi:hypothetical protein